MLWLINVKRGAPAKVAKLEENSAEVGEVSQSKVDIILSSEPDVCIRFRKVKTASPVLQEELQEDYFVLINIDISKMLMEVSSCPECKKKLPFLTISHLEWDLPTS